MRHIVSIQVISNITSFLQSLQIQLTSSNATTLRLIGLESIRNASSLPTHNITFFDLVTFWLVRMSEVRSGDWKNNRRENPIAFSIAFSLITNWDLRLIGAFSVHAEHPTRSTSSYCVDYYGWPFYNSKSSIPNGSASPSGKSWSKSQNRQIVWNHCQAPWDEHLATVKHIETNGQQALITDDAHPRAIQIFQPQKPLLMFLAW